MDRVELTESRVEAIVGILPEERVATQPMILDVELGLDLGPVGDTGDLAQGVDYAAVEAELHFLAREGRFWLIETFALAAARWLLLPLEGRGSVRRAAVRVRKPNILLGRSIPGVWLERSGPQHLEQSSGHGAEVTVLARTEKDGAWRVCLEPGASWTPGSDQGARVVSGTAVGGDARLGPGDLHRRGGGPLSAAAVPVVLLVAGEPVTDRHLGA